MTDVGVEVLGRFGLTAESNSRMGIEEMRPFADFLISGHAPVKKDEVYLNLASTDDRLRENAIDRQLAYVNAVAQLPKLKQINLHFAPRRWVDDAQPDGHEFDYDRQIDAIRQIAAMAAERGIEIVLENLPVTWRDVPDDTTGDQVDWSNRNAYFGTTPEEWIGVCEEVARPNVALCLDSSHACTYAHLFPEHKRPEVMMSFLARPDLLKHVHWSDNYLYDSRGREDSHAFVGKGTLPEEIHRTIKGLDATLMLEHSPPPEELEEELEYIDGL